MPDDPRGRFKLYNQRAVPHVADHMYIQIKNETYATAENEKA